MRGKVGFVEPWLRKRKDAVAFHCRKFDKDRFILVSLFSVQNRICENIDILNYIKQIASEILYFRYSMWYSVWSINARYDISRIFKSSKRYAKNYHTVSFRKIVSCSMLLITSCNFTFYMKNYLYLQKVNFIRLYFIRTLVIG